MGRNNMCVTREWNGCQEGSNNLHFNELWKALASLSMIFPKKFLQQSWEHLFLIQQPEVESIWRFRTWWKIIKFMKYFSWWEMFTSKIKLFETQRTTQFLPKSFLKLLRDCKSRFECFKDDRDLHAKASYRCNYLLLQMAILTEFRYLHFSLK